MLDLGPTACQYYPRVPGVKTSVSLLRGHNSTHNNMEICFFLKCNIFKKCFNEEKVRQWDKDGYNKQPNCKMGRMPK